MKRILLLSLLVLFGCSKDSEGENAAPGDEIIGTHQIIDIGPTITSRLYNQSISGTISFESDKKGSMDIYFKESGGSEIYYFDWSFDGQRWKILEQNDYRWTISLFDFYEMRPEPGQVNSNFRKLLFY